MKTNLFFKLLMLIFFFNGINSYSQLSEGFESTTGPDLPSPTTPSTWTLSSGAWSVFDNGVGVTKRWGISAISHSGTVAAFMDRENIGIGNISEDYLVTPLITIPSNGQLRFWSRSTVNGDSGITTYLVKVYPNAIAGNQTTISNFTDTPVQYTESTLTVDPLGVSNPYNVYTEKIVNLASYAGQSVYIAFVMRNTQPTAAIGNTDRWLLDDITIVQQCLDPSALTATAQSSTSTLSWTDNNGSSSWEVEVLPATGTPTGTGIVVTSNPYQVTGLLPNTNYQYFVRSICSGGLSSGWVGPYNFTTTIAPIGCGGNFVDPGGISGNYSSNSNVSTLICPTYSTDIVTVTFTSFNLENNFDFLKVYNGSNSSAPLIGNFTGTTLPAQVSSTVPGGCLFFVFTSDGSVNAAGWVASIACAPAPTCTKPTNLIANNILSDNVTLSWTQAQNPDGSIPSSWQILALPCGSAAPSATSTGWINANSNPFVYTGLNSDSCYTFYVRANCTLTDQSTWSTGINATTQQIPPTCGSNFSDPGGVSGNYPNNANVTTTICANTGEVVTVTFSAFNLENNFDFLKIYEGANTTGQLLGNFTGTTMPSQITSTGSCLTFVFTSDGSVNAAGWVASIACAPAPTCIKPTNLIATVNSSTSVILNWTQGQNPDGTTPSSWTVIVQPAGSAMPLPSATGITVTSLPFTINNLTPGASYQYWVRSDCDSNDSSFWSGPKLFYTTITCADSQPFCGNTGLSYQNTTGAPSYGSINCLITTPNPAWYYMQVQSSGNLSFQIAQTSNTGNGLDVDYVAWGPFSQTQFSSMCSNLYDFPDGNLTVPNNVVSCSYSAAAIENFTINNAVAGQYYIVLITNFSNQIGSITFTQTNNGNNGSGSTNCNIVCSVDLGQNQNLCNVSSYTITSSNQNADSYSWYNGTTLIPGQTGSTLVVTQSGDYKCVITCGLNTAEDTITITFNNVVADMVSNVTVCDNYILPGLSVNNYYYTAPNGTGTLLHAGDVITTTQTIYIYAQSVTNPSCTSQTSFIVSISNTPIVDTLNSVFVCDQYILPVLSAGNYYSAANGTGTLLHAGDIITTTQTLYIYAVSPTNSDCYNQTNFTITVTPTPLVDPLENVSACESYTLQNLNVGNYYTAPNGTGTLLHSGDVITTTQTIYIYAQSVTNPSCYNQNIFLVTINHAPVIDTPESIVKCDNYILPVLSAGNYYSAANGTGTLLNAGDIITTTQTLYIFAVSQSSINCFSQASFTITINHAPVLDAVSDVVECDSYVLPNLTIGSYYAGPNGSGSIIPAGSVITNSQDVYVFAQNGECTNQSTFHVSISNTPNFTLSGQCLQGVFTLQVTPINFDLGQASYHWSLDGNSLNETDHLLQVNHTGSYTCDVFLGQCHSIKNLNVTDFGCMIPKGISPNDDGLNDTFNLQGFDVSLLEIFNRYGTKVYYRENYTNEWEGKDMKGNVLPDGTYYYVIGFKNNKESKTGWVYINK